MAEPKHAPHSLGVEIGRGTDDGREVTFYAPLVSGGASGAASGPPTRAIVFTNVGPFLPAAPRVPPDMDQVQADFVWATKEASDE